MKNKLIAENAERRKLYRRVGGIRITGTRGGLANGDDVKFNADGMRRIIAHVHCSPDGHPTRPVRRFLELNGLRYISADNEHLEIIGPADKIALFVNPGFAPNWLINWHYKTDIRFPGAFPARKGPKYSAADKAKIGTALASSSARSVSRFAPESHSRPDRKTLNNIRVERNAKLKAFDRAEMARKLSDPSYVANELRVFIAGRFELLNKLGQYKKNENGEKTLVANKEFMRKQEKLQNELMKASFLLCNYSTVPAPERDTLPRLTVADIACLDYAITDDVVSFNREERIFEEFVKHHATLSAVRPAGLDTLTGDGHKYTLTYGREYVYFTDVKRAIRHAMRLPERINSVLVSWDIHCDGICVFTGGAITETDTETDTAKMVRAIAFRDEYGDMIVREEYVKVNGQSDIREYIGRI